MEKQYSQNTWNWVILMGVIGLAGNLGALITFPLSYMLLVNLMGLFFSSVGLIVWIGIEPTDKPADSK